MSERAVITPKIIKWARESARMSIETAASKVSVSPERIIEWEIGESYPTIKQAEILAKAYRRPFSLFFLSDIPRDFEPLQDFRRKNSKQLGTASTFIIREIQQKQFWISNLYQEADEPKIPFVGRFTLKADPRSVAKDILDTLKINPAQYLTDYPIKEWIEKAEHNGIFISRTSFIHAKLKLDNEELQGFVISDVYAPFIFINSDDWDAPQLFTLVHELAHIWIAATGISNEVEPEIKHKDKFHPVEIFCNEVAANALMPDSLIKNLRKSVFESSKNVFKAAKKIGISSFALLFKAYSLEIITPDRYKKLKKEADHDFQEFLIKEEEKRLKIKEKKDGGPNYYMLLANKNGHLFTRVVMDAFRGGILQPTQASTLLNTQVNNFKKLEAFLYK